MHSHLHHFKIFNNNVQSPEAPRSVSANGPFSAAPVSVSTGRLIAYLSCSAHQKKNQHIIICLRRRALSRDGLQRIQRACSEEFKTAYGCQYFFCSFGRLAQKSKTPVESWSKCVLSKQVFSMISIKQHQLPIVWRGRNRRMRSNRNMTVLPISTA